jgi:hypothetical protein
VALAIQFSNIIDRVEDKHNCVVIYFITDADGDSNKGHKLLKKARPWIFAPSCWDIKYVYGNTITSSLN